MTKEYREYVKSRIEYLLKISSFVFDERDKEALEAAIKALSQEPTDAISREAVKELIKCGVSTDTYDDVEQVCKWIDALPSVTQKSGKWINDKNDIPICSRCGYIPPYDRAIDDYEYSNYCPNCGSAMKGE